MRLSFSIFLSLLFGLTFSQVNDEKENQPVDSIQKIDGVNIVEKTIDPVIELSEDDAYAKRIDSLWMQELYNNTLFDSIYADIINPRLSDIDYNALPTDTLKARLKVLDAKTPFNIVYHPELEKVINNYLTRRRKSMTKLMSLSGYYFPLFEEKFSQYNIPLETKYLSIVESALNPRARSRVGASGLWQFMFTTGKSYKLNVNNYVDDRFDPVKSTEASARYLSKLYKMFGDWDLALAAYNSGPGNVTKAMRRSGGYQNYWNLRPYLPRETSGYVPAFLATLYIFEYAKEHGFQPEFPKFQTILTDTIQVKQTITFEQISKFSEVPVEVLQFYNPQYKLDVIPAAEKTTYTLRLPREKVGNFVANEEAIYAIVKEELATKETPLPKFYEVENKFRYRVRSGDYLGKIAKKFGVRVSQIKRWNGLRSDNLRIGQRLTIYGKNGRAPNTKTTKTTKKNKPKPQNAKTYQVAEGDSLWSIAQKFPGVSVENIKEWNDISGDKLTIGESLIISE